METRLYYCTFKVKPFMLEDAVYFFENCLGWKLKKAKFSASSPEAFIHPKKQPIALINLLDPRGRPQNNTSCPYTTLAIIVPDVLEAWRDIRNFCDEEKIRVDRKEDYLNALNNNLTVEFSIPSIFSFRIAIVSK